MSDLLHSELGLAELTALSRQYGTSDYVKGGGGNTSFKTRDTLWIKPSGTALADMTPGSCVAMRRPLLARLYEYQPPPDVAEREREVQVRMAAAREAGHTGRPSVETPLHDLLDATFVVHTHPMLVNGMTCGRDGSAAAARLFPDALWVPYLDPGFTLSMQVRARVANYQRQHGCQPSVILLENHGIFVAAMTPAEVHALYQHVLGTLRVAYERAGVNLALQMGSPALPGEVSETVERLRHLLGSDALFVEPCAPFTVVAGPLTPDHMVYAKAQPYQGELTRDHLASFRNRWGYPPRVVVTAAGVFGVGTTRKAASLALTLAQDGALVQQLAATFGGVQMMSEPARRFIESWEVESYREKQSLA